MEFLLQPWTWYFSGIMIVLVVFLLNYFGKSFGVSTNLETICTIVGAGKFSSYFKTDWRERTWGLLFVFGLIIGGVLSSFFLSTNSIILNPETVNDLANLGFLDAGKNSIVPSELFSFESMMTVKGFLILLLSGVCIGFGTRYARGCTSGHAITGVSSLQLPSLIAVIGFFTGGIVMVWVIFPLIF